MTVTYAGNDSRLHTYAKARYFVEWSVSSYTIQNDNFRINMQVISAAKVKMKFSSTKAMRNTQV